MTFKLVIKSNKIPNVRRAAPGVLSAAIFKEAQETLTETLPRTPIDKGALRASGHVEPAVIRGTSASTRIGFGGPTAPYALYVHEDLNAHHPKGEAKFLERTMKSRASGMAQRLAQTVRSMGGFSR